MLSLFDCAMGTVALRAAKNNVRIIFSQAMSNPPVFVRQSAEDIWVFVPRRKHVMHYMLLIAESAEGFAERNSENAPAYWSGWMAYSAAIVEAGIFVSGAGLAGPETATVLRFDTKGQRVQDGPFIDSKEQVGGFFIIDVPNLDAALDWARKAPITRGGSVEVRPCLPPPPRD